MENFKKLALVICCGASLATVAMPLAAAEGDAAWGATVVKKCKACHKIDKKKLRLGPHLVGLYGRRSGSVEGYKYSAAMRRANVTWNEATLSRYLADPNGYIPKNKNDNPAITGPGCRLKKERDRAALIAYFIREGGRSP